MGAVGGWRCSHDVQGGSKRMEGAPKPKPKASMLRQRSSMSRKCVLMDEGGVGRQRVRTWPLHGACHLNSFPVAPCHQARCKARCHPPWCLPWRLPWRAAISQCACHGALGKLKEVPCHGPHPLDMHMPCFTVYRLHCMHTACTALHILHAWANSR